MSHDTFKGYQTEPNSRLLHLKHLADHLISLAPFVEEPSVEQQAQEIVQEMESASTPPVMQLSQLERLAKLSAQHPEEPRLRLVINDTADFLLDELQDIPPRELKDLENLSSVWATIKAWDTTRSPSTAKLCVKVLDNFHGEAQAHLAKAFILAQDQEISFDDALEKINSEAA